MKSVCTLVTGLAVAFLSVASLRAQTVTGSGTPGTIPVWTGTTKLGNSLIRQSGGEVIIGIEASGYALSVGTTTGKAIAGVSTSGYGVVGISSGAFGVEGISSSSAGVYGFSDSHYGVEGKSPSGVGVSGFSTSDNGLYGQSSTGDGIYGSSASGTGVFGASTTYRGVQGLSNGSKGGVVGVSTHGDGIGGIACINGCGSAAVIGLASYAGDFEGDVEVRKNLVVSGVKEFHIDHPLDPANKYLNHASIESSEVLDMYSGNITTDLSGMATVAMPDYFSALNGDCRYQLTVVGQFAQAIVAREIENNTFVIKTDKPSLKVSWQVTGVRQDAWVKRHPLKVEEDKPRKERGYYLHPELFGQPEEKGVVWLYHEDLMRDAKALWSRENANSK
jgi:trimeric autotransporter adhesin